MNNKTLGFAAVAALAIGGGAFYWWRTHHEPASLPITANTSSADLASPVGENNENSPTQAAHVGIATSGSHVLTPRQRFEQSHDLFALVQSSRAAADGGDATAKTIIADAMYECISATLPTNSRHVGVFLAEKRQPELKSVIDAKLAVDSARCGRFTKDDIGSLGAVLAQYADAAKLGSAKALAMQLTYGNLATIPDQDLASDVQKIITSGDPDAIGALSNLMGLRAEGRASTFGSYSGSVTDQYAWQLAACRMGMDCGANSALLRGYCLSGGMCGAISIDQVISNFLTSPAQYRAAVAESQQIVSFLSGHH
ncbi:MAG: hypothetical protein JSS44_08145 [Proteobacteria bacterium]|nr:hypothetical protein [Pseudomonadota bacterium]